VWHAILPHGGAVLKSTLQKSRFSRHENINGGGANRLQPPCNAVIRRSLAKAV